MDDGVDGDAMAWVRPIDNDVQSLVIGPVSQASSWYECFFDDRHTRDEHEYGSHRYIAVIAVTHNDEGLLFCQLATFPFVF